MLTEKLKRCEIVIRIDIERVAREHPDSPEPVGEVETALNLIVQYGGFAEDNHGQWVIDQVARILASEQYDEMVRRACADGSEWELGIAP